MPRGLDNTAIVDLLPSLSVFVVAVPVVPATVVILSVVTFHFRTRLLDVSTIKRFPDVSSVRLVGFNLVFKGSEGPSLRL